MADSNYTIRTMTRTEIDLAVEWAAAEGWNPGLYDADCFHAADPNGFLIGLLGDEPVATISVVKYGASFGFLGFYIVKPEYRGRGYGLQLWQAGMASLEGRNVGLDGVTAQQENYKKSGFTWAYANIRYEGQGLGESPTDPDLIPLVARPFDELRAYDAPFFPEDRSRLLECWIAQPEGAALGILHNGKLAGYGVVRPCRSGYKIGPLFADTAAFAERLFLALGGNVPVSAPLFLDVPSVNPAAVALAERYKMLPVFETARMYTRQAPDLPMEQLFGVTTFELG